ncbi:hypothetical protein PS6_007958 [Mucor atramentarius]
MISLNVSVYLDLRLWQACIVMLDGANSDTVLVYANKHNGIKSEIENLKTNEFKRVHTGIGCPPAVIDDRSYDVGDRICAE